MEVFHDKPRVRPFGGRRGPIYLSDFRAVVERAAYKTGWVYRHRLALKKTIDFVDNYWVGVCVGNADASSKLDRHNHKAADPFTGVVGNIKYGMISEFAIFERDSVQGPVLRYRGWRDTLKYWVKRRWIAPTKEIEKLLGPTDFRSLRPQRVKL